MERNSQLLLGIATTAPLEELPVVQSTVESSRAEDFPRQNIYALIIYLKRNYLLWKQWIWSKTVFFFLRHYHTDRLWKSGIADKCSACDDWSDHPAIWIVAVVCIGLPKELIKVRSRIVWAFEQYCYYLLLHFPLWQDEEEKGNPWRKPKAELQE